MTEELKKKAYLEGQRLIASGNSFETVLARLDKMKVPEEMAEEVVKNLAIQHLKDANSINKPFYNVALFRIGVGAGLALIFSIAFPGMVLLPISFIATGIATAVSLKPFKVK